MAGPPKKRVYGPMNDKDRAKVHRNKQLSDLQEKQRKEWLELVQKHEQEQQNFWSTQDDSVTGGTRASASPFQPSPARTSPWYRHLPTPAPNPEVFDSARTAIEQKGTEIVVVDLVSDDEAPTVPSPAKKKTIGVGNHLSPYSERSILQQRPHSSTVTPKVPTHSRSTVKTPSPGNKRKRTIEPDRSPEVSFSQLRSQQLDQSSIKTSPTPISRDPNLRVLETSKENGGFVTGILHNGRSQSWHPELGNAFQRRVEDRDGDVRMEEATEPPQTARRSLVAKFKLPFRAFQNAFEKHEQVTAHGNRAREQSIVDVASRPPHQCPIESWTAGERTPRTPTGASATQANHNSPFKVPALPRASCPPDTLADHVKQRTMRETSVVSQPTSPQSRKRPRQINLSDDDSDFEPEASPCPSPRAKKNNGETKSARSFTSKPLSKPSSKSSSKTDKNTCSPRQPPPLPSTPPSKRIKVSTPNAPRKPSARRANPRTTLSTPQSSTGRAAPAMPPSTAQSPVPQSAPSTFRSASTSLDHRRQRRTAQVTAERKIKQIAAVEKIYARKASKEEKRKMMEEMQREDTESTDVNDVGGRMRSMSLTPMAGEAGGGGGDGDEGGSKNAGRGGYETWLKRRATGDRNRYVVRSESAE